MFIWNVDNIFLYAIYFIIITIIMFANSKN